MRHARRSLRQAQGRLWGTHAFFDDEFVDADVQGLAEFFEVVFPLGGPVVVVAAAEEVVPDVLGLPEVYFEGHGVEGVGDGERGGEGAGGVSGSPAAAASRRDHGALHALAGGEAEERGVEGDLVGGGAGEEGFDLVGVEGVGLDGAAEAGVDGEAGGEASAGGAAMPDLGEEVQEGGVVLVDLAEGVFHLGEGLVEDGVEDAVLLVGEERGEGVGECRRRSGR